VAAWVAETASCTLAASRPEPHPRPTEQETNAIVGKFADSPRVLIDTDPDDRTEIFRKLSLKLTCQPGRAAGQSPDPGSLTSANGEGSEDRHAPANEWPRPPGQSVRGGLSLALTARHEGPAQREQCRRGHATPRVVSGAL
jgi:hypothetical protein